MKKILTLFVMLLCGWSIVSAQTPAFGYQVVVRTADNELVDGKDVNVSIAVLDTTGHPLYGETQIAQTDDLGMLSLLVGTGTPTMPDATIDGVDWSATGTLRTTITVNSENVVVETPIYAVPCALQAAKANLTTDQIVDYVSDASIEDYATIMTALGLNADSDGELWNMIKQKMANYLMSRKDMAVNIAAYYLAHATAQDVTDLYNEVKDRDEIMDKVVSLLYDYAIANREYAMQLIPSYVKKLNAAEDVAPLIHTAINKINTMEETEKEQLENDVLPYLVSFAKSHRELVVNTAKYFLASASADQMQALLNVFIGSNMEKVFVYDKFYNYLDYYFQANYPNDLKTAIQHQVDAALAPNGTDPGYLQKQGCTPEINPCAE